MEQVPFWVLKKTRCAQGLCSLALIIPAVAFISAGAWPSAGGAALGEAGTSHLWRCVLEPLVAPWVVLVAGTGGCGCVSWCHPASSAPAWPVLSALCHSFPAVPGCQLIPADASSWEMLLGHKLWDLCLVLCLCCALTRGHCTTCRSLINNLLTCLAALCSVACFTTLPRVLECWFPWQPDIAFLFFITITVLLLPCSNALSSLFCLGVCVRGTNLFLKIILLNHLVNLEKGWWSVTVDLLLNGEAHHKWKQARKKNKLATQILIQRA